MEQYELMVRSLSKGMPEMALMPIGIYIVSLNPVK